jgi:hypothetical protein
VEAINNVREAHIAALNDDDVDAWVAAFTNDSVHMPPNAAANLASEIFGPGRKPSLTPFRVQFTLFVDEFRWRVVRRLNGAPTKST